MMCYCKHPFLGAPSSCNEVYQQTYTLCILINNPQDTVNPKKGFFPKLPRMQFAYKCAFFQVHPCSKDSFRLTLRVLRGVAQLGRAPGLGPGGRRFESYHPDFFMRFFFLEHILQFSPPRKLFHTACPDKHIRQFFLPYR